MRRVGTLTSACTLLALGLLLGSDLVLPDRHWFMESLNYWPFVVGGLLLELVYSVYKIRRTRLSERVTLDGRSLGLLFLVTVFSVNFYSGATKVAEGAEPDQTSAPTTTSLFTVTPRDVELPKFATGIRADTKHVVLQNPLGNVAVVGSKDSLLHITGTAHVSGTDDEMIHTQALALVPTVEFGQTMTVAVQADKQVGAGTSKDTRRVDLRIEVPQGMELSVQTQRGTITLDSYSGPAQLLTQNGEIGVDRLTGSLEATSQFGKVSVASVLGRVHVRSQVGGVTVHDVLGDLVLQSESGDVQVQNVRGKLDFSGDNGKMAITSVQGDVQLHSTNGLLSVQDLQASVTANVTDGEFRLLGGGVTGPWIISTTNTKVSLRVPKDASLKFLGETNKGVIKGPTKQSPGSATKTGALITEQMGAGTYPLTVRSDNGSIFVEVTN